MKVLVLCLLLPGCIPNTLKAQRCLDFSVLALMGNLETPGASANNLAACRTSVNDHGQTVIVDYGAYLEKLDTLINQKMREFTLAFQSTMGGMGQMPSGQSTADAQALAEKLKSMTPEQQKAWAMDQANQRMQASPAPTIQDDPATASLVMKTNDIGVNQLSAVNREFAAKIREVISAKADALHKVAGPDESGCPQVGKTGMHSCACVNGVDGKYWQQMVAIEDQYDAQKIALFRTYLIKIKALVGQVDYNIGKLNYGAGIKTKELQKALFAAQQSAFGTGFDITSAVIHDIHKEGADLYLNEKNSDKMVYNLSCEK
jgi:hypothetical protein